MLLEATLRASDHRMTRPRRVVWDVLNSTGRHLSAAEIVDAVHELDPGINSSSVYRTLGLFADLDLVRESRLTDEASTWEVAHPDDVIHLVCSLCGATTHHATDAVDVLRTQLGTSSDFHAAGIDVRVTGTCAACVTRLHD